MSASLTARDELSVRPSNYPVDVVLEIYPLKAISMAESLFVRIDDIDHAGSFIAE